MKNYLSLIKFTHTVFALPFALVGFFLAYAQTGQLIDYQILITISPQINLRISFLKIGLNQ